MKAVRVMAMVAALASALAVADEHASIFIKDNGRFIELTDSWFPAKTGIAGAMMAVDSSEIATGDNYKTADNSTVTVRPWQRDGDWIIIHFLDQGITKRFHSSEVESIIIDRPWVTEKEESSSPPAPS